MQSMIELLQSMRELIAGPKRRRGLKRFSGMCDGLEARQLMTAIAPGGFETEPNNSLGQHDEICVAVSGTAVSSRVNGALSVVGDPQDVYRLDLLDAVKSGFFYRICRQAITTSAFINSVGVFPATSCQLPCREQYQPMMFRQTTVKVRLKALWGCSMVRPL